MPTFWWETVYMSLTSLVSYKGKDLERGRQFQWTRAIRMIRQAISKSRMDLRGLTVLTEAATNNFVVTPVIAAMAGAKVFAVARDSEYGEAVEARSQTYEFAARCGVRDRIEVRFSKTKE